MIAAMAQDVSSQPVTSDPILDGDHERFAHIVLESARLGEDGERHRFADVTAAYIEGTPVQALCGKVWVPSRDPKRYPVCPTCREIAEGLGWRVPA
jgi:hypothetical protein